MLLYVPRVQQCRVLQYPRPSLFLALSLGPRVHQGTQREVSFWSFAGVAAARHDAQERSRCSRPIWRLVREILRFTHYLLCTCHGRYIIEALAGAERRRSLVTCSLRRVALSRCDQG